MITFVTLFLGLFLGTHPVELRVEEGVAAVELRLDGESLGRLEGPPWSGRLDFGRELIPHHLEAVALDAEGRELGRAERWINLPRPPAEVSLFLEPTPDGGRRARLFWESVLGTRPVSVRMELDGEPLPEATLAGADLPPLNEETIHFLRAELEFPDNLTTSAELVFGGGFQDAVDTELTAVPVRLLEGRKLTQDDLAGRLTADGEALPVVAVEEGGVDLILVPDAGALSDLRHLALEWESTGSLRTAYRTTQESRNEQVKRTLPLPREQRLRFLWPYPQVRQGVTGIPFTLFVSTPELTNDDGGLVWLMSRTAPPGGLAPDTRLTTAVAVAATMAASRNRRRAVVLLWSGGAGDRSRIPPAAVRRYLARLRVPFQVWTLDPSSRASSARGAAPGSTQGPAGPAGSAGAEGAEGGETYRDPEEAGWGPARDISTLLELERAYKDLTRDLERQRIVWVSGTRLPQSISLAPSISPTTPDVQGTRGRGPRLELARSPMPRVAEDEVTFLPQGPWTPAAGSTSPSSSLLAVLPEIHGDSGDSGDSADSGSSGSSGGSLFDLGRPGPRPGPRTDPEEPAAEPPSPPSMPPSAPAELEARPRSLLRIAEGVRLRAVPAADAPHLTVVDVPVELPVVERRGEWARVTYRNRSGWVRVSPEGEAQAEAVEPLPAAEVTVVPPSPEEAGARHRRARRARAAELLGVQLGVGADSLGPYDLLTDVEDRELRASLETLAESVEEVFESRYGLASEAPEPGEAVLLFAEEDTYRRYLAEERRDLGSMDPASLDLAAHAGGGLAALFVGDRDREQVASLLTHELTHLVGQRTLGAGLPPWLEEGLADDLAFSRIDRDGRLEPGTVGGASSLREERRSLGRGVERVEQTQEISGGRAALLRLARLVDEGRLPSLEHLVGLSRSRFLASEDRVLYYPLSAFFVRFLLDDPERSEAFREVLADVAEGAYLSSGLFLARLESEWGELQRRFESWLRSEARRLGPG